MTADRSAGGGVRTTRTAGEPELVSVIIPTRNRPALLGRAVASVLNQTYGNFEVVVVVDGADDETLAVLEAFGDARLRWRVNDRLLGGGGARNAGIDEARGEWVAFLDDDDQWLRSKLSTQLTPLAGLSCRPVVSFSRLHARTGEREFVWPRRGPRPGEPVSEYLLVRNSLFAGEGLIQTSTIVASRPILDAVRFDESLRRLQDVDWALRAARLPDVQFVFCPEPLAVWNIEPWRRRIGTTSYWQDLQRWGLEHKDLMTPRAFAAHQLVGVARAAAAAGAYGALPGIWRAAWRLGRPAPIDVLLFLGVVAVPPSLRESLRALAAKVGGWT